MRSAHPYFHNFALFQPLWTDDNVPVLAFARRHPDGDLLVVANFSEEWQSLQAELPFHAGLADPWRDLLAQDTAAAISEGRIWLEPCRLCWLVNEDDP